MKLGFYTISNRSKINLIEKQLIKKLNKSRVSNFTTCIIEQGNTVFDF